MTRTRRDFLSASAFGALGATLSFNVDAQTPATPTNQQTPGAPPAFGTSQPVGPEVVAATFVEAEKLVQIEMSSADIAQAAGNWREAMAPLYERRTGPRKMALEATIAPATVWNPMLPGILPGKSGRGENDFIRSADSRTPLPANDADIAYASVAQLSRWIQARQITSERLTKIYLDRLQQFDPKLRCVITLTRDHALEQARQADTEIAAGKYRGPLHGIPCKRWRVCFRKSICCWCRRCAMRFWSSRTTRATPR